MGSGEDARLVEDIQQGGAALDRCLQTLYLDQHLWEQIWAFVRSRGGEREDAEDIFQDGIRLLILNVRNDKYAFEGSVKQYLRGICRHLWFKRFRDKERQASLREAHEEQAGGESIDPERELIDEERSRQIEALLDQLPSPCREVLECWKLGYSMQEIADRVGYKSEGVARKKKHQCLQKLMEMLEQQPGWKHLIR